MSSRQTRAPRKFTDRRAEQLYHAARLSRLQAAFPWSAALPVAERERFGQELSEHSARTSDRELDRLLAGWKARARAYERRARPRRAA
ncbi:MAG TPA: hypothetical protein VFQ96_03630 [Microbacteriaceae bacterium]|nr:hypothetical protein [Microbacteriaceae bacterium]